MLAARPTSFMPGCLAFMRFTNAAMRRSWLSWPGFSSTAYSPLPLSDAAMASAAWLPSRSLSEVMNEVRLELGESAAKVTTGMPIAAARLMGSMNGSGFIGCSRMPAGLRASSCSNDASCLFTSYSGVPV
ncbi:hypothetical protein D9M68_779310 [compost metagenome]